MSQTLHLVEKPTTGIRASMWRQRSCQFLRFMCFIYACLISGWICGWWSSCVQLKRLRLFFRVASVSVRPPKSAVWGSRKQNSFHRPSPPAWMNFQMNAHQIVDEHVVACHPHFLKLDHIFLKSATVKPEGGMTYQTRRNRNIGGSIFSYVFISCLWGPTIRSWKMIKCTKQQKGLCFMNIKPLIPGFTII